MALLFVHSCDAGDDGSGFGKWSLGAASPTVNSTNPRFAGTLSRLLTQDAGPSEMQWSLPAAAQDDIVIAGYAFRPTDLSTARDASGTGMIALLSDSGATQHITLTAMTTGQLRVRRGTGSGTILGTTASSVLTNATWAYVALKATLHDSAGAIDVEVDGANVLSVSGIDTKNSGTKTVFDTVAFGRGTQSDRGRDFYICNGLGSKNNNFLGDVRITALPVTGDTTPEQWTPSTGSDSYAVTDEIPPNTTDYIESSTVGHITRMTLANLTDTTHEVFGVQVSSYAAKSDAGAARSFRNGIFSDASVGNGATYVLGTGHTTYLDVFELDPDGNIDFDPTSVNALAVQVEVVS